MALSRVNPIINSLPDDKEEEKDKGKTLFGGGFLEKATKRIEEEKALAKVAGAGRKPPPAKQRRLDNKDPNDLRRFFGEGYPCKIWRQEHWVPTAIFPEGIDQREEQQQCFPQAVDKEQLTSTHTNLQFCNSVLFPIPGVSCLPTADRLPCCLQNWQKIMSDQWVLQVVRGYKLELLTTPTQKSPPQTLVAGNHHLISEEVQKLMAKVQ